VLVRHQVGEEGGFLVLLARNNAEINWGSGLIRVLRAAPAGVTAGAAAGLAVMDGDDGAVSVEVNYS